MYTFLLQTNTNIGDFFTTGSFTTLLGCTGIVLVVSNGIQSVFNFSPKWLALAISLVVSLIAASLAKDTDPHSPFVKYLIAVLNAFLIHASATGVNQMTSGGRQPAQQPGTRGLAPQAQPVVRRSFASNWWR